MVLLTATPVNNSLTDLETLIKYFIRDDARFASLGIPSIREYIKQAQAIDPANLTPEHLFDLMDQVAVRRTRKFVKEHYANEMIIGPDGKPTTIKFPQPRSAASTTTSTTAGWPSSTRWSTRSTTRRTHAPRAWEERSRDPETAHARSLPVEHVHPRPRPAGVPDQQRWPAALRAAEAAGVQSPSAARVAGEDDRLPRGVPRRARAGDTYSRAKLSATGCRRTPTTSTSSWRSSTTRRPDRIRRGLPPRRAGGRCPLRHRLLRRAARSRGSGRRGHQSRRWANSIEELTTIAEEARRIDPRGVSHGRSPQGHRLLGLHRHDHPDPRGSGAAIEAAPAGSPLADYKGRVAPPIMGSYAKTHERGASGGVDQGGRASTIAGFAPQTAGPRNAAGEATAKDEFDILFTTDVLAEGVNLQQAGQMINYDLPWNPMRIVQRHGRVDRIGSKHDYVHLGLFFPSERLDALLALEARLEAKLRWRMPQSVQARYCPGGARARGQPRRRQVIDEFEKLLDAGGSSASLSGEEYRRRLYGAFSVEP